MPAPSPWGGQPLPASPGFPQGQGPQPVGPAPLTGPSPLPAQPGVPQPPQNLAGTPVPITGQIPQPNGYAQMMQRYRGMPGMA